MTREQGINIFLDSISKDDLVITCNGKIGRELFELRKKRGEENKDFIMIGSMGCALGIALGVAMNTKKKVYCLLGDGNLLMKLGTLATCLKFKPDNLKIVVFNNDAHDSTGGQETYFSAIKSYLPLIEIVEVSRGARHDLGRPDKTAEEIKNLFIEKIHEVYA